LERESAHEKQGLREHKIRKAKNTTRELFTQILKGDLGVRVARWRHRSLQAKEDSRAAARQLGERSTVQLIAQVASLTQELQVTRQAKEAAEHDLAAVLTNQKGVEMQLTSIQTQEKRMLEKLREHKIKKAKNTTRELFTQILKGDLGVRVARWRQSVKESHHSALDAMRDAKEAAEEELAALRAGKDKAEATLRAALHDILQYAGSPAEPRVSHGGREIA
jgi:chromosome segregation ATPase